MVNFEENLDRFFNSEPPSVDSGDIDIGGSRDDRLAAAIFAAMDDLDNLDEEFATAHERFAFTHDELERAKR